ncbi:hypothetical protein CDD83_1187 [Cordyceps sp. RAO-2017]|nr:hypothetical protein CDD83_1187 [Cordyceps sp. RAO-2017]
MVREAGFPPGVVNIVNGRGPAAGAALARHPHVDKIAFTGSTETAIEVARTAAATMKSVTLEAGGKSPIIVFDDADLPQAVRWAHEGVMANQGQVCSATSRLLVQDGVHDAFVEALVAYTAQRSVLGDPFDQATYQGPQVSAAQRDRVLSYIAQARAAGATVTHPVGPVSALPRRGFFAPPTIFTDVPPAAGAVFRDEIFGPCAAVMRFGTEDEAVAAANGSRYGLAAAVMTRDLARAHRLGRRLEAGTVWINSSNDTDVRVPFGGVKQSGLGRELGEEGLRPYYTLKAVHVNLTGA